MGTPVVENKNRLAAILFCAPTGIRTPVVALKGLRPGPLDDGGGYIAGLLPAMWFAAA